MLKEQPHIKLKTETGKRFGKSTVLLKKIEQHVLKVIFFIIEKTSLAHKRQGTEGLIEDKRAFLELQKNLLLKEHKIKMKILALDLFIKTKEAEALGYNANESQDHTDEGNENSD